MVEAGRDTLGGAMGVAVTGGVVGPIGVATTPPEPGVFDGGETAEDHLHGTASACES